MRPHPVQVGIIGSGFGSRVTLPCFSVAEGMNVLALASRTPEKMKKIAEQYKVKYLFSSLEQMLNCPEIDLVCIEVPPFLHSRMVGQALQAGKHILCEKPMALNVEEARQIFQLSQGSGTMAVINHQMRFHPNCQKIKKLLGNSIVGNLRYVQLAYFTAVRCDPSLPWDWWSDEKAGGGQLLALGSHFVDLLRWWFGEIRSVQGHLATFTRERMDPSTHKMRAVTSDEYVSMDLEFCSGLTAVIVTSCVDPDEPALDMRITGSEGSLVLRGFEKLFLVKDGCSHDLSEPDSLRKEPVVGLNPWRTSLVRLAEHLVECIQSQRFVHTPYRDGSTFWDGVRIQEVLEAVKISHQTQRRVGISQRDDSPGSSVTDEVRLSLGVPDEQ